MPKFVCSYAHDIACFADFVVEAKSEQAALRKIRKALREGKFENVNTDPAWDNRASNERVFVQGTPTEFSTDTTLEELLAAAALEQLIGDKASNSDQPDEALLEPSGTEIAAPDQANRRPRTRTELPFRRYKRRWKI